MSTNGVAKVSSLKLMLGLLAYVVAFAVPTALLAVFFRVYAGQIVAAGGILLLAVSSFQFGWQWDDPGWTAEARGHAKSLPLIFVVIPVAAFFADRDWRLQGWTMLGAFLVGSAITIYVPFFIGRGVHRRRRLRE